MVGDQNLSQKLEHQLEQGLGQGGGEESKWQWSLSRSRPRCLGCPCKWPKKHHWEDKAMEKVFTLELFSGKICVCRWGGGRGWVLTDNNRYFLNCPSRRGGAVQVPAGLLLCWLEIRHLQSGLEAETCYFPHTWLRYSSNKCPKNISWRRLSIGQMVKPFQVGSASSVDSGSQAWS